MHGMLKLVDNTCINSTWLDVNSVFSSLLVILYVAAQYNDSFHFERTRSCSMYCLNQSISSALLPVVSRYCYQDLPWVISWVFSPMYTLTVPLVTRFILS